MSAASTALLQTIATDTDSTKGSNNVRAGREDGGLTRIVGVHTSSIVASMDAGGRRKKLFIASVSSFHFQNFTPGATRVRQKATKFNAGYDSFGYSGSRLGARQDSSGSGTPFPHLDSVVHACQIHRNLFLNPSPPFLIL